MQSAINCLAIIMLGAIGCFLLQASTDANVDLSAVEQISGDWNKATFTKIYIDHHAKQNDSCREGYTPIFHAEWPGTDISCDCNASKIKGLYNPGLHVGEQCNYFAEELCHNIRALPAQDMSIIHGNLVCGKANGPSFIDAKRPNPTTKKCPKGT